VRRSGTAPSGHPNYRMVCLAGSKLQRGGDVISLEVGIIMEDILTRGATCKQLQDVRNPHAKPPYTGPSPAHFRVCRDSLEVCQVSLRILFAGTIQSIAVNQAIFQIQGRKTHDVALQQPIVVSRCPPGKGGHDVFPAIGGWGGKLKGLQE